MNLFTKHYFLLVALLFIGIGSSQSQQLINKTFKGIQKLEIKSGSIEIQYEGNENRDYIDLEAFLGQEENADKNLVMITVGNTLKIEKIKNTSRFQALLKCNWLFNQVLDL